RSLLSQLSINSLRTTYDTVKNSNGGYSHNVPIHKELIKAAQSSFSFYNEELSIIKAAEERIRKEKEEKENASKIYQEVLKQEEELLMTQKDLQKQQQEANSIIADGSARLQLAIKKKDSLDIERATILIDGGNNKSKIIGEQLLKVTEDLIDIQKKRKSTFNKQQAMKKLKTTADSNTSVK
ncbi:unnamed protein product, partial [Rotaria magnacalcarata]